MTVLFICSDMYLTRVLRLLSDRPESPLSSSHAVQTGQIDWLSLSVLICWIFQMHELCGFITL